MAEPGKDPLQDNRTNTEKEMDSETYREGISGWDGTSRALKEYEAIRGYMPEIFSHPDIRGAYDFMQKLFK